MHRKVQGLRKSWAWGCKSAHQVRRCPEGEARRIVVKDEWDLRRGSQRLGEGPEVGNNVEGVRGSPAPQNVGAQSAEDGMAGGAGQTGRSCTMPG